jgi:glycerol-3-phosphate dehydrogenase
VINEILSNKINMIDKKDYKKRRPITNLKELNEKERNDLVKIEPAFGRIVCRCEQITEGEIIDAIRRPLGAKTVKGVKKRVRPGMGRCQGGFCEPLVVDILARELKISPIEVRLDSDNSEMLMEETKE